MLIDMLTTYELATHWFDARDKEAAYRGGPHIQWLQVAEDEANLHRALGARLRALGLAGQFLCVDARRAVILVADPNPQNTVMAIAMTPVASLPIYADRDDVPMRDIVPLDGGAMVPA